MSPFHAHNCNTLKPSGEPPFNVDEVIYNGVKDDPRFNTYGIPKRKTKSKGKAEEETVPNANYLWINLFATSLKDQGRAALVMANSASDARHSEAEIRRELIEQNLIYGMLTLPSNMFYTVTLPATLWFFDKGKAARGLDERILFIDARNVFTQIDRAHREFSPAQIQNLATISRLYCGQRDSFIDLIDSYFADGMQRLTANAEAAPAVTDQVAALIDDEDCARAAQALRDQWTAYPALQQAWTDYQQGDKAKDQQPDIDGRNARQRALAEPFAAFFTTLHNRQKALDKAIRAWERAEAKKNAGRRRPDRNMKALKAALDTLRADMRDAEQCFAHVEWLQSRFPEARYDDVVGLCKAATQAEIEEQDWSLNPGRYVGVVIEEDGKTEEEFIAELEDMNSALLQLNQDANGMATKIDMNICQLLEA